MNLAYVSALPPGAYVLVLAEEADTAGIVGRQVGLELRDTLIVFRPTGTVTALVFRKPLGDMTVAGRVVTTGVGAINVDVSRVGSEERVNPIAGNKPGGVSYQMSVRGMPQDAEPTHTTGRWPPNMLLVDERPAAWIDAQSDASRYYPRFDDDVSMLAWLARLIATPVNDVESKIDTLGVNSRRRPS